MEFHEKLQQLRKSKSLTQEELASALFVSRTAVSKWESGRGYPSIDSLKEIARFFSVTIDELICQDELISAAENEKKEFVRKYTFLICHALDILTALLLVIPVFGNGTDLPVTVSAFRMTGVSAWIKPVFIGIIAITVLNGICGVILSRFDRSVWHKHRLITGIALSVTDVTVFIITRQPYAGIISFAFLIVKGFLLSHVK